MDFGVAAVIGILAGVGICTVVWAALRLARKAIRAMSHRPPKE